MINASHRWFCDLEIYIVTIYEKKYNTAYSKINETGLMADLEELWTYTDLNGTPADLLPPTYTALNSKKD